MKVTSGNKKAIKESVIFLVQGVFCGCIIGAAPILQALGLIGG